MGSIALFLESDGDGAAAGPGAGPLRRARDRRRRAEGRLLGGRRPGGRRPHRCPRRRPARLRGAARRGRSGAGERPQELLELARCLAQPRARPSGDGGTRDPHLLRRRLGDRRRPAGTRGLELAELGAPTRERLTELLPGAATVANPLDYTSMLWDQPEVLELVAEAVGFDPGSTSCCCSSTSPRASPTTSASNGTAVRRGAVERRRARRRGDPARLDPARAARPGRALSSSPSAASPPPPGSARRSSAPTRCAAPRPDPARLEQIAAAAESERGSGDGDLAERGGGEGTAAPPQASGCRRPPRRRTSPARSTPPGRWAGRSRSSSPPRRCCTRARPGRWPSTCGDEEELRDAVEQLLALPAADGATLLVERMDGGRCRATLAARRDGVVPVLAVGLGGIWAEALDDVALVPLPASPARVERALRSLRGAAVLAGRRGAPPARPRRRRPLRLPLGELLLDHHSTCSRLTRRCSTRAAASPSTPSPAGPVSRQPRCRRARAAPTGGLGGGGHARRTRDCRGSRRRRVRRRTGTAASRRRARSRARCIQSRSRQTRRQHAGKEAPLEVGAAERARPVEREGGPTAGECRSARGCDRAPTRPPADRSASALRRARSSAAGALALRWPRRRTAFWTQRCGSPGRQAPGVLAVVLSPA